MVHLKLRKNKHMSAEDYLENKDENNKVLWETEFYAISVLTGAIEKYQGMYIEAETIQDAMISIRNMQLNYLQLTGTWFKTKEDIARDEKFYKELTHPRNIVGDMNYDEFVEWLDLATEVDDLYADLAEHVKIIDAQIKLRYGDKEEKNNKKDDTEEETGS